MGQKDRHYMITHTVYVVSKMDPLKFFFDKPALNGRIERWMVMLAEFDLKFIPQKSGSGCIRLSRREWGSSLWIPGWAFVHDQYRFVVALLRWCFKSKRVWCRSHPNISWQRTHPHISTTGFWSNQQCCRVWGMSHWAQGRDRLKHQKAPSARKLITHHQSNFQEVESAEFRPNTLSDISGDYRWAIRWVRVQIFAPERQPIRGCSREASMVNIPKELKEMPLVIEKRHEPAYVNALDDNNENEEETPCHGTRTSSTT